MTQYTSKLLIIFTLSLSITGTHYLAYSQDTEESAEVENATPDASLGDILSENMQNILRAGNIFLPNGQTAQPVNPDEEGEPERFTLNFNNASIDQVLKFLSDLSNKVVLKADDVDGRVTIMSPNEVTKEEALGIIDAAFMLKGFTFLESDQSIIVIPLEQAKQRGVNVNVGLGGDASGTRVETRILELQYASPNQMKDALSPLLSENANIVADERSQTLVITDTTSNINRLAKIIEQLDKRDTMQGVVIRVFKLRYLDADELDNNLDDILQNIVLANRPVQRDNRGRIQGEAPVEVLADETSNSLIISAPQEAIDEVARFIESLDTRGDDILQEKIFTITNGDAESVAETLQELAESRESNVYQPTIVADARTNSVIISGYSEDIEAFGNLINLLDEKISYDEVVEVYPLENSDAIILSEMIQQLLGEEEEQNNWWNRNNNDEESQIQITEDQRLNALVVTARPSDLPRIERLIEKLDQPIPKSKEEPRIFPIKYVRASDVAMLLNQLFQQNQQQGNPWNWNNQQQQQLTGLTGKVKVISDPTTNSIIVIASTPRAFSVIEGLIEELDRMTEFSSTRVFRLDNADANYLQEKLSALFEDTTQGQGNQGFWFLNQSANQEEEINNLIGNVRIESETRTNSLLVTTNSQYFGTIETLIAELDKEIDQIQVEILILEIQDVSDTELGIDWDGAVPITAEGVYESGADNFNQANFAVIGNTQIDMVLNYLASTNKTNVLARPNILTGDNSEAFVEAINRVPRPDEFTFGNTVATQSITYEEVGLKLTVRPQINNATTVTIDVHLENGTIIEQFSLVSSGSTIPAFTRRTVDTILTVNNSETAVLSGVINTQFVDTEKGIPGLMHIPLLGNLFKTKGTTKNKTELMVFITPYILSDQDDREEALLRQQKRLQLYEGLGKQLKDVEVDFGVIGEPESPTIEDVEETIEEEVEDN